MASRFQPRRRPSRFAPRPAPAPRPTSLPLPPAAVVDAVLRFHDVALDQGGDRTLLRLSEHRLHEPEVEAALGPYATRAARVAILWNERESQIVRVFETALAA